jgi:pimeloyl-ACP methyl ester carboxylesterase
VEASTVYRTTQIDGLSIFYREAGPTDAPTLLLLHELPSSSRMFEPLFARIADRYHLVEPDYPGFGHSDWPDPKAFAYTFDHYAVIVTRFTEALGLKHYTLYMQDYGGPVRFRMALTHPERIEGLIWGKYDLSFEPSEPEAYRRDVPNAGVHVLDAGHFALDTAADEIAELVGSFLRSALPSSRKGEVHA